MKRCLYVVSLLLLHGCAKPTTRPVVLYCALDQIFSEKIIGDFEGSGDVDVKPVYDTEATKTVGLVSRLIAEKENPQCDVFWNNEIVRTIVLKRKGCLVPYKSSNAEGIPALFRDDEAYWTGFAVRARVLIYNREMLTKEQLPKSIFDLTKPEWQGKVAMALPLFGTTATHAAALFATLGDDQALKYYRDLKANGVRIVAGNATARDVVVRGEYPIAFTDTDDAYVAMRKGAPVDILFPDQGENGMGTLVIPNTVAIIRGGPHPKAAEDLVDYLLDPAAEEAIALCGSAQIPVRAGLAVAEGGWSLTGIKAQEVDWEKVADKVEPTAALMREMFAR